MLDSSQRAAWRVLAGASICGVDTTQTSWAARRTDTDQRPWFPSRKVQALRAKVAGRRGGMNQPVSAFGGRFVLHEPSCIGEAHGTAPALLRPLANIPGEGEIPHAHRLSVASVHAKCSEATVAASSRQLPFFPYATPTAETEI
jgi:hypothetical protein